MNAQVRQLNLPRSVPALAAPGYIFSYPSDGAGIETAVAIQVLTPGLPSDAE